MTAQIAKPYVWVDPDKIPLRAWLYDRHLIRRFISADVAAGAGGKTSLHIAEALAMATGRPLLGVQVPQRLRVWYWNLEDPYEEIQRRVAAACKHFQIGADDLNGWLFVNDGRADPCVIVEMRDGVAVATPRPPQILADIQALHIDVLDIDPFVSCHSVPENDNSSIDKVAKTWNQIADAGNCAVRLSHHIRKGANDGDATTESARGAKALTDACRSVRILNRMTKQEAEGFGIDNSKAFFRLNDDKANLAPAADKSDWYRIIGVDLENGINGPGDHVGVVTAWRPPDAFHGVTVADLLQVQRAIHEKDYPAHPSATDWVGYAVAEVLHLDAASAPDAARIKALLKTWISNGALVSEKVTDKAKGREKPVVRVGRWAD